MHFTEFLLSVFHPHFTTQLTKADSKLVTKKHYRKVLTYYRLKYAGGGKILMLLVLL